MVSALRVIGTDKKAPIPLDGGSRMYADNALCEAAMPPETTVDGMVARIRDVILQMKAKIGDDFSLVAQASHVFDKEEMEDKNLWEVGCTPSFNAWTETQNLVIPFEDTMRTGSFHIHLGDDMLKGKLEENDNKALAIKMMDSYLGCASVLFDKDPTSLERRRYYGRAGEFRSTPYGIEYRVLGNWALRSPETTKLCFDLALHSLSVLHDGFAESTLERVGDTPIRAINTGNKDLCVAILKRARTPDDLWKRIFAKYDNKEAWL